MAVVGFTHGMKWALFVLSFIQKIESLFSQSLAGFSHWQAWYNLAQERLPICLSEPGEKRYVWTFKMGND
jgi:hypothetical protein